MPRHWRKALTCEGLVQRRWPPPLFSAPQRPAYEAAPLLASNLLGLMLWWEQFGAAVYMHSVDLFLRKLPLTFI